MNRKQIFTALFLITASCIGVYANSLNNPFIWDDDLLIKNNHFIKNWSFLPRYFTTDIFHSATRPSNFYRPLQTLTLSLDYHLWKLDPFGYHLTNTILHLLVSILVYFLILALSRRPFISLLAALLFAVHPVHTEAVTYIAGRADSLAAIFLLSALLTYRKDPGTNYIFSLLFFVLALLAKESALIFPLILILYELSFRKDGKSINFKKIFPFFLAAIAYLYLRFYFLNFTEENLSFELNRAYFLKAATSIKILFFYFKLLIFPQGLQMGRSYPLVESFKEPALLLCSLLFLLIILAAVRNYRKSKLSCFFIFWFFLFLLPYTHFIRLNALVAEHWLYLSSIGFFALLALLIKQLSEKKKFLIFAFVPFFLYYSSLTVTRNFEWGDEINFYRAILRNSPDSPSIWYNLGTAYLSKKKLKEAEKAFQKMLVLKPAHAEGLVNLGIAYWEQGKSEKAKACALKAIEVSSKCTQAHCFLGNIYSREGLAEKAKESYLLAIEANRFDFKNYLNMGTLYANQGKLKTAVIFWEKALELNPESFEARYNLEKAGKNLK